MIIKEVPKGKGRFEFAVGLINESRKNNKAFQKQRARNAAEYRRTLRSIGERMDSSKLVTRLEVDGICVECPVAYREEKGVDYFGE